MKENLFKIGTDLDDTITYCTPLNVVDLADLAHCREVTVSLYWNALQIEKGNF